MSIDDLTFGYSVNISKLSRQTKKKRNDQHGFDLLIFTWRDFAVTNFSFTIA